MFSPCFRVETLGLGVAFYGEHVRAASVIIDSRVQSREEVEKCLLRLKNTGLPESNNTLGFMFACLGRGAYHYHKANVEADAFRRFFPRVPLAGFFGNGEIGFDYLPNFAAGETEVSLLRTVVVEEEDEYEMPEMDHSYTTVFVLVCLGE